MRGYLIIIGLWAATALGQKPKAIFIESEVEVGKEVRMAMSYLHAGKSGVVFPDSSFDFSPFVYLSSQLFETRTQDGLSLDSVIYTLVTYELDSVLSIRPYISNLETNEQIYSDSVFIRRKSSLVRSDLDNPSAKITMEVFPVRKDINLPKISYYVLGFLILAFLISAFFGEVIRKRIKLWQYDRTHRRFLTEFRKLSSSPRNIDNQMRAVKEWKDYLELLEKQPISTMSTSELGKLYGNERLETALKAFDSAIFGGVVSDRIPFAYRILQDFAIKRYRNIRRTSAALVG